MGPSEASVDVRMEVLVLVVVSRPCVVAKVEVSVELAEGNTAVVALVKKKL